MAKWHAGAFLRDPELYALATLTDGAAVGQRARVAKTVLAASWAGLSADRPSRAPAAPKRGFPSARPRFRQERPLLAPNL